MATAGESGISMAAEEKVNGIEHSAANGKNSENGTKAIADATVEKVQDQKEESGKNAEGDKVSKEEEAKKEEMAVEVEPKTGISFPVKLDDEKQLISVGLRKKSMLGMGIKVYGFGMYADSSKLKDLLKAKFGEAPAKPTKEMYEVVIDSDVPMTMKLVIVFSALTMSMAKKNFDEGLGASIKKLTGGKKNEELTNKLLGHASDEIKLTPGSVIEISRLPGYVLHTKVMDQEVSKVESELLCRAYIHMYLGDDPLDKEAKEKFGMSLLTLF